MVEALVVIVAGALIAATWFVIRPDLVARPAVLGIVAWGIAIVSLVVAESMLGSSASLDPEDIPGLFVAVVGLVHVGVGLVLFAVSAIALLHRRRSPRPH